MPPEKIKLVLLDVDGVLTDGLLWFGENGEIVKSFHARDGLGISFLQDNGIKVGVITGRISKSLDARLADLQITIICRGTRDKLPAYETILRNEGLNDDEVAYMGDDLLDLKVMQRVGLPAAPADAVAEVLAIANFIAPYPGGKGAVRALAELILRAQGKWPCV